MTVNGGIPDWLNPIPFGDAGHAVVPGKPGQLPGNPEQWEVLSEDQLQQMRKQLLESVISAVVQAVRGLFVPGPFGTALDQLTEWANNLPTLDVAIERFIEMLAGLLGFPNFEVNIPSFAEFKAWISQHVFGFIDPHRLPLIPVSHIGDINPNLLSNPSFVDIAIFDPDDVWTVDTEVSHDKLGGSATVMCTGQQHELLSADLIGVARGQKFDISAWVKMAGVVSGPQGVRLGVKTFTSTDGSGEGVIEDLDTFTTYGDKDWRQLRVIYQVPDGVNTLRVRIVVTDAATAGQVWFDDLWCSKKGLLQISLVDGLGDELANIAQIFENIWERIKDFLKIDEIIAFIENKTDLNIDEGPIAFLQSLIDRIKERRGIDLNNPNALVNSIQNLLLTLQEVIAKIEEKTGLNIDEGPFAFIQSLITKIKERQGIDLTSLDTLFSGLETKIRTLIQSIAATIQQVIAAIEEKTDLNIDEGPVKFMQSLIAKIKERQGVDLTSLDTLFSGLETKIRTLIQTIALTIQQIIAEFEAKTGLNIDEGPIKFMQSLIAKIKDRPDGVDLTSHTTLLGGLKPKLSAAAVPEGWQGFLDKVGGKTAATDQTLADRLQHLNATGLFNATKLNGLVPNTQVTGLAGAANLGDSVQTTWNKWMAALTGATDATGDPALTADQIKELMATVVANATAIAQLQADTQATGGGISGGDDFDRPASTTVDGWNVWTSDPTGSTFVLDGSQAMWSEKAKTTEVRLFRSDPKDSQTKTAYQSITRVNGTKVLQSAVLGDDTAIDTLFGRVSADGKDYIVAQMDNKTVRLRYSANQAVNPSFLPAPAPIPFQSQTGWTLDAATSQSGVGGSALVTANGTTRDLIGANAFTVTTGQVINIGAWVKTATLTGGSATIGVEEVSSRLTVTGTTTTTTYVPLATVATGTADWVRLVGTYTVPAGVTSLRLQIRVANTSGQVWFDNVYINSGEVDLGPSATLPRPAAGARFTLECGNGAAVNTYRVLRNGQTVLTYTDSAEVTALLDANRGWGFGGESFKPLIGNEFGPSSVNSVTVADNMPTVTVGTYLRVYRGTTGTINSPDGEQDLPDNAFDTVDRQSVNLGWDKTTQTLTVTEPGPYTINTRLEFSKDIASTDRWELLLYCKKAADAAFPALNAPTLRGASQSGANGSNARSVAGSFSIYLEAGDQVRLGIGTNATPLVPEVAITGDAAGSRTWMTVTRSA